MFARFHSAEVATEAFDTVIHFAESQRPEFETQRGFSKAST